MKQCLSCPAHDDGLVSTEQLLSFHSSIGCATKDLSLDQSVDVACWRLHSTVRRPWVTKEINVAACQAVTISQSP